MEPTEKASTIKVLDFTEYPGPRYKEQGDHSGELFYEKVLKPEFDLILKKSQDSGSLHTLIVNLDDTAGYASSFLDESFGNLAYDYSETVVKKHLKLITKQEPDWNDMIFDETLPEWDQKKKKGIPRKPQLLN
ncbi:STAS-like domain-containing protein [Ekhidna sp.]|uniref:STAS-like domain-containing protein n=1 Tax=Ekhidna sp. TaxID=2608089 RepID=UPI003298C39B